MNIAIVGAGIFGCIAALDLSQHVEKIDLYDSDSEIMKIASRVNQARLHTGLHYPRDLKTAIEANLDYEIFKFRFPTAVREINQYYAIASEKSKTSAEEFLQVADILGLETQEVPVTDYLDPSIANLLVKVPESTFDIQVLRSLIGNRIKNNSRIQTHLNTKIASIIDENAASLVFESGKVKQYDFILCAAYASNEALTKETELEFSDYIRQLCQVVLLEIPGLRNTGITIMDGPFWSTMPFGFTDLHSLTHVLHTPIEEEVKQLFACQRSHDSCGRGIVHDCELCIHRRKSNHKVVQDIFEKDTNGKFPSKYVCTLQTVKYVPTSISNPNAPRPTDIIFSKSKRIASVVSGKIGSSVHISERIMKVLSTN